MSKHSKKAQVEVSFNWVFVLIAGAAILFFFIRVITSETDIQQDANLNRAVNRMNTVLTALQQNPDSVSMQPRISYEIEFTCTIEGQAYGIKGSSATQSLPHQLVFAPETVGDSRLITWVRRFDTPYPVSSMLYLTDEETKYVFIKDHDTNRRIEHFYNLFPGNISKAYMELDDFKEIEYEGYRKYVIVITNNNELIEGDYGFTDRRVKSRIKYVMALSELNDELIFYELKEHSNILDLDNPETRGIFTEESIIGAIITGDPFLYECTMNKALEHTRITTAINIDRIRYLHEEYPQGHNCKDFYAQPSRNHFENLKQAAINKEYSNLNDNSDTIRTLNNQIIRSGCVPIY